MCALPLPCCRAPPSVSVITSDHFQGNPPCSQSSNLQRCELTSPEPRGYRAQRSQSPPVPPCPAVLEWHSGALGQRQCGGAGQTPGIGPAALRRLRPQRWHTSSLCRPTVPQPQARLAKAPAWSPREAASRSVGWVGAGPLGVDWLSSVPCDFLCWLRSSPPGDPPTPVRKLLWQGKGLFRSLPF